MSELTTRVRARFPGEYDDLPDAELEARVIAKYPEYRDLAESKTPQPPAVEKKAEPSFFARAVEAAKAIPDVAKLLVTEPVATIKGGLQGAAEGAVDAADTVIPMALRVGGAVGGGIAGGAVATPSVLGIPAGVVAGGALGGGLGETAAEGYEIARGTRNGLNPTQIGVQTAISAVPIVGKAGAVGKTMISRAAQGGVLGGVSSAATDLAEGQTPTLGRVAGATALGAALGGGAGALEAKALKAKAASLPPKGTITPESWGDWGGAEKELPTLGLDETGSTVEIGRPVPPVVPGAVPPVLSGVDKLKLLSEERRAAAAPVSKVTKAISSFRSRFVNQFDPVDRFMKDAGLDVITEPAATNPVKAIDLAHGGTPGKIEKVSHEFRAIASDAEKAGLTDDLEHYLDLNALEAGAETLARKGGSPAAALGAGKALPKDITPTDLTSARAAWNARPATQRVEVESLAKRVFTLNENTLDIAHDAGLIKPDVYTNLKARAATASSTGVGGYAPLSRVLEEVEGGYTASGMNMPVQHALYNLEGSEKLTKHPVVSSFQRAAVVIKEAEKNKAMQTLVDMPKNYPGNQMVQQSFIPLGKTGSGHVPNGYDKISLFEKGERVDYAVPAPLASAVKALDAPTTKVLGETMFRAVGNLFRTGVTMGNVAFSIPNVVKDISDLRRLEVLPGQTDVGALGKELPVAPVMRIAGQWAVSLSEVVRKTPSYQQFLDSGAAFGTFQRSLNDMNQMLKLSPTPGPLAAAGRVVESPLEFAKAFNNALEEATKLTAFKRQLAAGASEADAAWATRRFGGSPDFARRGTHIAALNTMLPFLNAQIQGVDRIIPYMQKHPLAAVGALAAVTAKLAMLQQYNNSYHDPDGVRSWDRLTDAEKQNNYVVFLPRTYDHEGVVRHDYVLIPLGHTVGLMTGPIRAMLDPKARTAQGITDYSLQNMPTSPNLDLSSKGALAGSIAKSAVAASNPLVKVPVELYSNEDSFRRVPIVPERLKQVEPRQQFTAKTSPAAVAVGDALNVSPLQIQHGVRGFTGGVGDQVMDIANTAVEPSTIKEHIPVVSTVARRFLGSERNTIDQQEREWNNTLYTALAESQQVTSTVAALKKRGDADGVRAYLSDPAKMLAYKRSHALQLASQRVSQARAQQDHEAERQALQSVAAALGGGQ
jgi:hypothetical protein